MKVKDVLSPETRALFRTPNYEKKSRAAARTASVFLQRQVHQQTKMLRRRASLIKRGLLKTP